MSVVSFEDESKYWLRVASLIPDRVFDQGEEPTKTITKQFNPNVQKKSKKEKKKEKQRQAKKRKIEKKKSRESNRKKQKFDRNAQKKRERAADTPDATENSSEEKKKGNSFSFGAIDTELEQGFTFEKKKRKTHDTQKLKEIKKKQQELDALPQKEKEEAIRKQKVADAFKRIAGEKVVDDVSKLKKKIKKREKRKQKSQKEWKKRTKKVKQINQAKQTKRATNLGDRAKAKIEKKLGPRVTSEE